MGYYNGRADFEGNMRHLMNHQTNLSQINTSPGAGLVASQGDINKVLRELAGLTAAVQSLAGKESAEEIHAAIRTAVESTAANYYVKADGDASVYALDVATGRLRPVTKVEWDVANSAGFDITVISQKAIDAAPKYETNTGV